MGRTEFRKSPPPRSTIEIRMALPKNHIICPSHILGTMTCSAEPKICDLPQLCPFFLPLFTKELPNDVEKYGKMISCSRGGSVSCGRPGRKANLFPALDPKKKCGRDSERLRFSVDRPNPNIIESSIIYGLFSAIGLPLSSAHSSFFSVFLYAWPVRQTAQLPLP